MNLCRSWNARTVTQLLWRFYEYLNKVAGKQGTFLQPWILQMKAKKWTNRETNEVVVATDCFFFFHKDIFRNLSTQNHEVLGHIVCFELKHEEKLLSMMHDDFVEM